MKTARRWNAPAGATLLVLGVTLLSVFVRTQSEPIFHGQVRDSEQVLHTPMTQSFGDDLRGAGNAFLSLLAESLRREGWAATGGVPLLNVEDAEPLHFVWYDHHPPGVPWMTALAFHLRGASEGVARSVALLFTGLTALILFAFAVRAYGRAGLVATAAALTLLPAGWYWGSHLNYEVPTLPFALLFLLGETRPQGPRWAPLSGLVLCAAFFMDLVALFAVAALVLERARNRRHWPRLAGWLALSAGLLVAWTTWKHLAVERSTNAPLWQHLRDVSLLAPDLDVWHWLREAGGHAVELTGGWPLLVVALEVGLSFRRGDVPGGALLRTTLTLAVLAWAVPAVRSLDHPYYAVYFQLPVALACGRLALRSASWMRIRWLPAFALAAAVSFTGYVAEHDRTEPAPDRPSSSLLGRQFAHDVPAGTGIVVEPTVEAQWIVVAYYAGRRVVPLLLNDETGVANRYYDLLGFGRALAPLWMAEGSPWPGRDGRYHDLPIPPGAVPPGS